MTTNSNITLGTDGYPELPIINTNNNNKTSNMKITNDWGDETLTEEPQREETVEKEESDDDSMDEPLDDESLEESSNDEEDPCEEIEQELDKLFGAEEN